MKKWVCLYLLSLTLFFACSKKEEAKETITSTKNNIFNVSQISAFKEIKKISAVYENFEKTTLLTQTPNVKDVFVTISFPFSYKIKEVYISKGNKVKKGDKLFLITSEELVRAYKNYLVNKDEETEKKLASIGIDLNKEPTNEILIVSPEEGTIVFTANEKTENSLMMQNTLAIIQKSGEIIFNLLLPEESYSTETYFYALIGEKKLPLQVLSADTINKTVKIILSLKGFDFKDQLQSIQIAVVNIIQNVIKVPKEYVSIDGNKFYCYIESAVDIIEKREIEGFYDNDFFIATSGIRQAEKILADSPEKIKKLLKI